MNEHVIEVPCEIWSLFETSFVYWKRGMLSKFIKMTGKPNVSIFTGRRLEIIERYSQKHFR